MSDAYISRETIAIMEAFVEDLLEMDAAGAVELDEWPLAKQFIDIVKFLR